ncbi:hypothetical protein K402DRAFT_58680 [Aulographum hederae CBS 113979]|uniref:Uncharacterized protein n=1 Tax=Aulographum hederae CBS 113979 TaxID=1176131 RepID=A0A6G1H2C3_9PEZI|nr:hypothetical protein K402DRAFT_58680 [Aulographum hederae CBS 113979]
MEYNTPEQLYKAFTDASRNRSRELGHFRTAWKDPQTHSILDRAKKSSEESSDLSAALQVQQYGWTEEYLQEAKQAGVIQVRGTNTGVDGGDAEEEDGTATVNDFKQAHPSWQVERDESSNNITISFRIPTLTMTFVVSRELDAAGYLLRILGANPWSSAINRCLASRPRQHNLAYTLEMVAAYSSGRTNPCAACGKLADGSSDWLMPSARRSKAGKNEGSVKGMIWEPFHEKCL